MFYTMDTNGTNSEELEKNSRLRRSRTTFRTKDRSQLRSVLKRNKSDVSGEKLKCRNSAESLDVDALSLEGHDKFEEGNSSHDLRSPPVGINLARRFSAPRIKLQWCELPQVQESGILEKMTDKEKALQEAMYELISTERTHLEVLKVLFHHFADCPEFATILSKQERDNLFPDLSSLINTSEGLLEELEEQLNESVILSRVCDILLKHAKDKFTCYVKYCCNLNYQERTLFSLKERNPEFVRVLQNLESNTFCKSNSLHSHIVQPMQRVTKYPLLVSAILERLQPGTDERTAAEEALQVVRDIASRCNETKRKMEETEQLLTVANKLQFKDIPTIATLTESRKFLKEGSAVEILTPSDPGSRRHARHLFLFNDLLIVSTKKSNQDLYRVLDYCRVENLAIHEWSYRNFDNPSESSFLLDIFRNYRGQSKTLLLAFKTSSERSEWISAITETMNSR